MSESLPTLYKLTSTGKVQMWEITTEYAGVLGATHIVTTYGLLDGKKQTAIEAITEGKNLGKANETTHREQAELEAKSQWEKKVKKGYVQNIGDAEEKKIDTNFITGGVDPMLAQSYDKHGHKIKYPAYVQPKLDGHRCIAIIQDGKCTLWSRTRKPIKSMPHIVKALEDMFQDGDTLVLDGELYHHDYHEKFEELTSKIRQETPAPGHEIVQYWIYDVVTDVPFENRKGFLNVIETKAAEHECVTSVATFGIHNEEDMVALFGIFMDHGYEGAMVRNADGLYKGKRSYDLQKVKLMQDTEYEIVDVVSGKGKMADKALFRCITPEGKEFGVKMKGALDDLTKYLEHKEDYIHKYLTVQYQKLSAEGVPIFPVGLRVREDV